MANSKYEYVRAFEREEVLLPNTWIVVRVDGRGFHKLVNHYSFTKPNDPRALCLMNAAATHTLRTITDICLAYGVSDEYSFVFEKDTKLFERRRDKILSTVVSTFTAGYIYHWDEYFCSAPSTTAAGPNTANAKNANDPKTTETSPPAITTPLDPSFLPTFDARPILYPSTPNLRDYLSWRQVDCHINNLYNTTFWALVQQGGLSAKEAEEELKGSVSSDKNEILWGRFGVNYNDEPAICRKGSIVYRNLGERDSRYEVEEVSVDAKVEGGVIGKGQEDENYDEMHELSKTQREKIRKKKLKAEIVVEHVDTIKDEFWDRRPWILGGKGAR